MPPNGGKKEGFMFIHTRNGILLGDVHDHCTAQNHIIREQALAIPEYMYFDFRRQSRIFLGRSPYALRNSYIGVKAGEDFLGVVLGSRKTTAVVIPTLATFRGSTIALGIKPKGKMFSLWQQFNRRNGKPLLVFNPMNRDSWGYNPLTLLKFDNRNKVRHANELSLSILPTISNDRDKVWRRTAQRYITAVILYCFDIGAEFNTIMVELQSEPVTKMLKQIMDSDNVLAKL